MENLHIACDWTDLHFVRKAVRADRRRSFFDDKHPVSEGSRCRRPHPAISRFVDLFPEPISNGPRFVCHIEAYHE